MDTVEALHLTCRVCKNKFESSYASTACISEETGCP